MIDVRLTATNPEDSTLVPVPCNARGELLTVAPKIELIPNDVEIDGDLTVTGLINGSQGVGEPGPPGADGLPGQDGAQGIQGIQGEKGDPGEGVPQPYGQESQVLTIVNSVPAWADSTGGPPREALTMKNWNSAGQCVDWTTTYTPEIPYEWLQEQESWCNPTYVDFLGYQVTNNTPPFVPQPMEWEFSDVFGKVLTMFYNWRGYRGSGNAGWSSPAITTTWSDSNISLVNAVHTPASQEARKFTWMRGTSQLAFIFNRDVTAATLSHTFTCGAFDENLGLAWCGWQLEDAGNYAINRQIKVENELKRMRAQLALGGMTTDIDLSRPTQD